MQAFLRRFTIRQRLLGSVLAVSLMIIVLGGWSALALRQSTHTYDALLDRQAAAGRDASGMLASLERVQRLEQSVMLNGNNTNEAGEFHTRWKKEVESTRGQIKTLLADPARAAALGDNANGFETYAKTLDPILQQVVDAKMDATAAYAYASQAAPELDKARNGFNKWVSDTETAIEAERSAVASRASIESTIRLVGALVVLGLFGALMFNMVRSIVGPLQSASRLARNIAGGNLSSQIEVSGRDEISQFTHALQEMQASLHAIVAQVRSSADSILTASSEVASGNLDLSQRTEHTASNLQQTSSSMDTLSGTLRHSAEAAHQASGLAGTAQEVAQRGGTVVSQVVQTMEEINQASRKIADITGVIDGIAFQTNILALNAAVEAARAGEQGRGFAVVAGEVRTLAQRSADAAREIKALIGASVDRVENGTRQVQDAGQTMTDIVGSVQRVADIINEISHAATEQSQGIQTVGSAVSQLDQMTQQNAALVEQSAAAAESLKTQAHKLSEAVSTFQLH